MRYLPLTDADRGDMLARIGVASIDDLFADIPRDKRLAKLPDLPRRQGEMQVERLLGTHGGAQHARHRACPSSSAPAPISTMCRRASII